MAAETKSELKKNSVRNSKIIAILLCVVSLLVICRLAELQIINKDYYSRQATNSQWSDETIPAIRGTIYDANGTVLAQSAKTWQFYLIPEAFEGNDEFRKQVCKDVADTLGLDFEDLLELTAAGSKANTNENGESKSDIQHKKVVKKQMEYAEKILIECDKTKHNDVYQDGKLKEPEWDRTEYGEVTVTDCLYHRSFKYPVEGKENTYKTVSYSKVMGFDEDSKRYYPMGDFASGVLGFVDAAQNGVTGIERYYNSLLSGTDGRKTSYGTNLDEDNDNVYDAVDGVNLRLTIDETIQHSLTTNLTQVLEDCGGMGAYGIVMNVKTGAILGMENIGYKGKYDVSNPTKLNDYYEECYNKAVETEDYTALKRFYPTEKKYEEAVAEFEAITDYDERIAAFSDTLYNDYMNEQWNSYLVSETYHPGSVFKIFLASAAVEENAVVKNDIEEDLSHFTCYGSVPVDDRIFNCHASYHEDQDLRKGLMNSCNPYFITLGKALGKERFFQYFESFGFTEKTGIESLEESKSIYFDADELTRVSLASESFGQTFSVTPIQMITGIAAIANGGYLMQPYLVDAQLDDNGNVISKTEPVVKRQVISEETAAEVASMMEDVVKEGTGRNGKVAGYRVAGKTGTTQKYQLKGTYIASFGCFAPADDPEIAVLIIVDEPQTEMNGSIVCAPVASRVVESSLEYLGVERQYTEDEMAELDITIPTVIGSATENAVEQLESAGFTVRTVGEGEKVCSQNPLGGQSIPRDGIVVLYTEENQDKLKTAVPDFLYMSANGVKNLAAEEGLNVKLYGELDKGVCFKQDVAFETDTEYGTIVKVYFKTYSNVGDGTAE